MTTQQTGKMITIAKDYFIDWISNLPPKVGSIVGETVEFVVALIGSYDPNVLTTSVFVFVREVDTVPVAITNVIRRCTAVFVSVVIDAHHPLTNF